MRGLFQDRKRSRAILLWMLPGFVAAQLLLLFTLEVFRPDVNDPEFEIRSELLDRCREAEPDRPLLLVVGSSRLVTAFHPEAMPALTCSSGEAPLAFNFSHFGAGPFINLIELRRILDRGVRPRWIVLEVMPPFLAREGTSMITTIVSTGDLPYLGTFLEQNKLYGRYLRARLLPCCKYRSELCSMLLPGTGVASDLPPVVRLRPLGGFIDDIGDVEPNPADAARLNEISKGGYLEIVKDFHIAPEEDAALRRTIELAQEAGVRVALLLTPESTVFRSWYAPGADQVLAKYVHNLSRSYDVPVVDLRAWLPDREFWDAHHLFGLPAKRFTANVGREVLQPFVDGKLPCGEVIRPAPLP